jgi:predicted neutral ceramidase superfamily lipid hydrolase
MTKEIKRSILIFVLLLGFWVTGAIVDTALWGHSSYRTPTWVIENMHLFWLALNQFLLPLAVLLVLAPKLNTLILFLSVAFSGSVLWDLIYSVLTRGELISNSMERWFVLDNLGIIIKISEPQVIYFHIIRILISAGLFYFLYKRLKKNFVPNS